MTTKDEATMAAEKMGKAMGESVTTQKICAEGPPESMAVLMNGARDLFAALTSAIGEASEALEIFRAKALVELVLNPTFRQMLGHDKIVARVVRDAMDIVIDVEAHLPPLPAGQELPALPVMQTAPTAPTK